MERQPFLFSVLFIFYALDPLIEWAEWIVFGIDAQYNFL